MIDHSAEGSRRRHPSSREQPMPEHVVYCPCCGHVVEKHCEPRNLACDWWKCPTCKAYGDSHGRLVQGQEQRR